MAYILRYIYLFVTFIPRLWHRHGFGIQSPHDYELVRDVLFEHLAYYAYEDRKMTTSKEKLLYRLHLRFGDNLIIPAANNVSAGSANAVSFRTADNVSVDAFDADCSASMNTSGADCGRTSGVAEQYARLSKLDSVNVLFVDDISSANLQLWNNMLSEDNHTVSFDMGGCGLIIFDKSRIKQNYIL